VERAIVGFHVDAEGVWVGELACGHRQHVPRPPFRGQRLDKRLECRLCDQNLHPPTASTEAGGGRNGQTTSTTSHTTVLSKPRAVEGGAFVETP
jgi:hypothetical protein